MGAIVNEQVSVGLSDLSVSVNEGLSCLELVTVAVIAAGLPLFPADESVSASEIAQVAISDASISAYEQVSTVDYAQAYLAELGLSVSVNDSASVDEQVGASIPLFYQTAWNSTTSPKTTANFDVLTGDVLVAYSVSENYEPSASQGPLGYPPAGTLSITWSLKQSHQLADNCELAIWSGTVGSNQSGKNVAFTCIDGTRVYFGGNVLLFSGSDGVGASAKNNGSGQPTLDITTTQDNSAIVVIVGDWSAVSGARTWRSGAGSFSEQSYYADNARYGVHGGFHPDAGASGTKTVGMTAPSTQTWVIAAVEIKGISGGVSLSVNDSGSISEFVAVDASIGDVFENEDIAASENVTVNLGSAGDLTIAETEDVAASESVIISLDDLQANAVDQASVDETISGASSLGDISAVDSVTAGELSSGFSDLPVLCSDQASIDESLSAIASLADISQFDSVAIAEQVATSLSSVPDLDVSAPIESVASAEQIGLALDDLRVSTVDQVSSDELTGGVSSLSDISIFDSVSGAEQVGAALTSIPDVDISAPIDSTAVSESISVALSDLQASTSDQAATGESVSGVASLADIVALESLAASEQVTASTSSVSDLDVPGVVDSCSIQEAVAISMADIIAFSMTIDMRTGQMQMMASGTGGAEGGISVSQNLVGISKPSMIFTLTEDA
jgi:hypothetical protein